MSRKNSKDMWTSVSAITDASDCFRRWWFNKVVKLPQPQRKATIFGDILHAVCERFLEADDRGMDTKGFPVELYPAGWMTMHNRFDKTKTQYTISDTEAVLIKTLVQQAIDQGVLVREHGRVIEKELRAVIYSKGFAKAVLVGFIDLDTPSGVTDHKSAKSKKWIASKNKLKKLIQMMGYAMTRYNDGHKGNIWLTHNNFIKDFDKPEVIQRSVEVTEVEVRDFFNETILPLVRKMLDYYIRYPKTMIHKWREVPGANNPAQSCNYHYGRACPYLGVCHGRITIDDYLRPYGETVNQLVGNIDNTEKKAGVKTMGLIDKINAKIAAGKAASGAPPAPVVVAPVEVPTTAAVPAAGSIADKVAKLKATQNPPAAPVTTVPTPVAAVVSVQADVAVAPEAPAVPVAAEPPPATVQQTAPWHMTFNGVECGACKDNAVRGYSSSPNKKPCRICDIRAAEAGKPTSTDYTITTDVNGVMTFTLKGAAEPVAVVQMVETPVVTQEVAPVAEVPVQAITAQPTALAPDPAPLETPALVPQSHITLTEPVVGTGGGVEVTYTEGRSGFDLLVGCTFSMNKNGGAVIYADDLMIDMLADISKAAGKVHYSAIEHFALMQAVDAYVPTMVPELAGITIVSSAPAKGSAHARLIDGLRMYADTVIQPFAV